MAAVKAFSIELSAVYGAIHEPVCHDADRGSKVVTSIYRRRRHAINYSQHFGPAFRRYLNALESKWANSEWPLYINTCWS